MKVSFDKEKLLSALTPAAGISQTKNTIQSAEGLLFECPPHDAFGTYEGDNIEKTCRISAFDLEKGLQTTVECTIYEEGMYIINTSKILQIVRALPSGEVTLTIDERNHVTVSCGLSSFEITANSGEDFPKMPVFSGDTTFSLPQHILKSAIEATSFAAAVNDQRAAFNGLFVKVENSNLIIVGCDGSRLAVSKNAVSGIDSDIRASVVVPAKFMSELSRLLKDTEDDVKIIIARKHIICKIDNIYFFTRMIEAEYINYERILPTSYMSEITISRQALLSATERASIVTEDKLGGNSKSHVKLDSFDSKLEISSVSQGGSIHESIVSAKVGNDLTIGFNCKILLDVLKYCPSEAEILRIRTQGPLNGIIIEPVGGSGFLSQTPDSSVFGSSAPTSHDESPESSFLYFVMPIRMK